MLRTEESNYKRSVKDSDDSVRQNEHESNYRHATHKRTKFVQVCRGTLYNALRDADKSSRLNQNRTIFGGFCVIKKIFANRLRGIVEMLSKYFFTALKKITAHAQNFSSTLYVFDYKRNEDGLSELKILVSVVRFRPGPPRI
jgi:hypothetical protein